MSQSHNGNCEPLRSQYADDPEMAELIDLFVSELPERVNSISEAATAMRLTDLQRIAHQLKGASAGYGFPAIGETAAIVEAGLKSAAPTPQETLTNIRQSLEQLLELCRRASTPH